MLVDSIVKQAGGTVHLPEPGDWNSVLIGPHSNDRNVASVTELESPQVQSPGSNGTPDSSEFLGDLAPSLTTGDETRRLGYQIQGVIANPGDVDVYSFRGTAGTEVWLDIDRTLNSLDTVVELVDANGRILAQSDNSLAEEADPSKLYTASDMPSQSVHSLRKSTPELYLKSATGAPKDLYSTNPRDAGMRVVLPGEPGSSVLYHVRVRSSNLREGDPVSRLLDPNLLNAGITRGAYELQIRLREEDEVPGSSVTYADLRYATNGIEIVGMPGHSPLLGETAESNSANDTPGTAQPIGNILTTDRQALSIAGTLDSFTDVDWYSFDINYTAIRPTGLRKYFATVFDVDYADGIGRPDTSIYVFDSQGRLILSGLGSNLVDDQSGGLAGAGSTDLSRGSAGSLDPFIGSAELPEGQYFLAVTNSDRVPGVMESYTNATPSGATAAIRLQPINGVQLIAEDHINSTGGSTAVDPQTPVLFPQGNSAVPFNLSDVNLYVSQTVGTNATNVYMVNPFTGGVSNTVGRFGLRVDDIAFRYNGGLRAFDWSPQFPNANTDQDTLMDYIDIDPGTAVATDIGDLNLQTSHVDGTNAADSNDGIYPSAITFASIGGQERGFIVGSRGTQFPRANVGTARPGVDYFNNIIYEFDENNGNATSAPGADKTGVAIGLNAGTAVRERGYIETGTLGAPITGLIAREATRVLPDGSTQALINDGDTFTLLDSANFTAVFEFDSGPEVLVNWDPAAGQTIADGTQFKLDGVVYEFDTLQGTPGTAPGTIAIPINAQGTYRQLVDAIARHVKSGITVTSEGNRLTFGGAMTSDFTQLQNQGIFFDQGSNGNVSPGAIKVPFLATDSATDVAARMAIAINSSGIPGLSATTSGAQVNITGGTVADSGSLNPAGAPGGTVTGAAVINGVMYAVSDAGGLYRVSSPTSLAVGNVGTYVSTASDLIGIHFTGLSAGPAHAQNGAFAQTLFGIDDNGIMYAFDTAGRLLPIFAGGASSVDTGLSGATGLSFSTLDYNLWHVSNNRGSEAGHGLPVTPDASRGTRVNGGNSLYFGFESPSANGVPLTSVTDPGIRNSYDFPGGAAGAIESQPFDLSGLSEGDLPTLYFNYRFDTENANAALPLAQSQTDYMRDSFRVYVSGEDGQWILAATNNSTRGPNGGDDEFDPFLTGNSNVQELFDNNGQWRQARVPLDAFAGQSNVKLRIEFSSAGGFGFGAQGGQGPQLRMISGDRLADGQTVTIGGRTFELEMGPSLSLPAGSSIHNGDSVTIEGVNYVFTDGSGPPVASPDVAVPFTATQSAEEVAATLLGLIQSTPRPQATINLTATEQNDTLGTALIAGETGDSAVITVTGTIGDNATLPDPTSDVDLVRVELARGATVMAQVNALSVGSTLDSYLRVFDSQGRQLYANDNAVGTTDSRVFFTAPSDGTYYFGVSGSGNAAYKPAVFGTGNGASSGDYQLVINVARQLNAVQAGGRIQLEGAAHVAVSPGSAVLVQGSLGTTGEPVYVNAGMTANQVGQAFQQALARLYADGRTTAFPLYGDTLSLTGLVQYDSIDFLTGMPAPSLQQLDPGPFGATTNFVGDAFNAFNASTDFGGNRNNANPGALRAQNNAFEGVYVDDFIIGVAGRGEMVENAPSDTSFIKDPQLSTTLPVKANPEVLVGPYQVEIRGGSDYGTPLLDGFPTTLALDRAVSPQERLSKGVSIVFNGASALSAGSTFTISDGTRQLTFELDNMDDSVGTQPGNVPVPFSNAAFDPTTGTLRSESAQTIAARVRDIINSAAVQSVLDINAILINSDATGETSPMVVLIGQANVNVPASIGQTIISNGDGDSNRQRDQGQIVVKSAKVTNSRAFGVRIDAGGRDALGVSQTGSPRNLLTLNTDRLTTGAVVMNSEMVGNLAGGISVTGDPSTSGVAAAVPYARLVNNTIVGTVDRSFYNDRQYADSVVSYLPGLTGIAPVKGLDDPAAALNAADYSGSGEPTGVQGAVSLGVGGQLTVEFTNNSLVGDGNVGNADLAITEVGTAERYLVEVSPDGVNYRSLGFGVGSSSFDVDGAFGQTPLRYVRITDDGSRLGSLDAAGADIDAVVAVSSAVSETGIRVASNASPTILNSVITNSPVGLQVDASSSSTVVGGMVYHRNTANTAGSATLGQFPQVADATKELFVDVANGNLYPAPGSPVIDSSMDSLQDRPSLVAVKSSIGLGASPILAPQYDINGSLRVDDPNVASPSGLGENVFKDRGAEDRSDSVGPSVVLLNPADNDVGGLDSNPATSVVELTNFTARFFDIQLYDGLEPSDPNRGSNINDSTVNSSSVQLYRDNVPLVEGIDYRFGYDATTNVIRLTPLAGVFSTSSVYQIRFVNSRQFAVNTQLDSSTNPDGSTIDIVDANNGKTTFELDTGYRISVPTSDGVTANVGDGGVFTLDDGTRRLQFEFDTNGSVATGNLQVPLSSSPTVTEVSQLIQAAINLSGLQFSAVDLGSGILQIDGSATSAILAGNSGLQVTGHPGVRPAFGLQIPLVAGRPVNFVDGETFTIQRTSLPVTFELDTNGVVTPGRIPVRFTTGASAATIGQALVTAIRSSSLGLQPTYAGNGVVTLGGDANTTLGLSNTQLLQAGTPGLAAARAIKLSLSGSTDSAGIAAQISTAINAANLPGVTATPFGDRVVISGAKDVSGSQVTLLQGITDNAGNALKANQLDGSTTLTVFLGEGMDYGDAPDPIYTTKRDNNGPRHTVVPGFSLGPQVRPDADAKTPDADEFDDGVQFTQSLVAAFQSSVKVEVNHPQGTNAYLSGWIDYNGDGVFSASERIANALPITQQFTTLSFVVSGASKVGTTYARFRVSSDAASVSTPVGAAPDGEVEDYQVTITANPYQNQTNRMDVNNDGHVSPIDVLQVINYINDPTKPKTLGLPPTVSLPPYVDVNGDGSVSGIDALLVINYLNSVPPGGSGEGEGAGEGEAASVGSSVVAVSSGDWLQGLVGSAAPAVTSQASTGASEEVQPRDAFFASMDDEEDDLLSAGFDSSEGQASVYDAVIGGIDGSATEVDDAIVADQAGWTIRQRLGGFFRS
ncbi:MAG: dockerin type I domain-containing protein [Aureliella sp.]